MTQPAIPPPTMMKSAILGGMDVRLSRESLQAGGHDHTRGK